jgi:hypothetical protein
VREYFIEVAPAGFVDSPRDSICRLSIGWEARY